ncbi:LCP family protein [Candidatus Peregrinibacteria bacterium]|nr:LCP family protein [Candidatus Peregrinibacteria bacterium]
MNFKIKKISKTKEKTPQENKIEAPNIKTLGKKFKISFSLTSSLLIILVLVIAIVKATSSIDFKVFLKAAGGKLEKDAYGHTNFLILGTGNKNHEGADLTDTIIVASLDDTDKLVTMVSLPRDFFIKDTQFGYQKINQIYYTGKKKFNNSAKGLEAMKNEVEKLTGIPIHYWIKIDFDGFKDLVDALGGVDIDVKKSIYDPFYPRGESTGYEIFSLPAGKQHLDGDTALKFARSRKTTSDFDRADRQQQLINAIKEKALQTQTLINQAKIANILDTLKANIETNISAEEILTLGSMAPDYSSDKIEHRLVHNDPSRCGGFLYNPPEVLYYGMYVLIPADKNNMIFKYLDLSFNWPQVGMEKSKIEVLNGTKRGGAAAETKQILRRFCFDIAKFGNTANKKFEQTTYYYQPTRPRPKALDFLEKLIPGKENTNIPDEYTKAGYPQNIDIILEMGSDYTGSPNYIEDPFYGLPAYVPSKPASATTTPSTTGAKSTSAKTPTPPISNKPSTKSK